MEKVFENPRVNQTKLGDILSANGFGYDVTATYTQRDSNQEKFKSMVMTYINDTGNQIRPHQIKHLLYRIQQ